MITVNEAKKIISDHQITLPSQSIPIQHATHRVLAETIMADRDFPPYNRVTMDGIAIKFNTENPIRSWKVEGMATAGSPSVKLPNDHSCIEVMTGAILPEGADTVIRYEDIRSSENKASLLKDIIVHKGQNIHYKGEDNKKGESLIFPGEILNAPEIAICASVGKSNIQVTGIPKIMIISTGEELVEIKEKPQPHQIRRSNIYAIHSELSKYGISPDNLHLPDDQTTVEQQIKVIRDQYDVILLSGGVSKGKFDYIPGALEKCGISKHFHRVSQRPGKPFWFGSGNNGPVVFAFPGNPVSTFVCLKVYFIPWLEALLGINPKDRHYARLKEPFTFNPNLTYFMQVILEHSMDGITFAIPTKNHGSGDLTHLSQAEAFLELPSDRHQFEPDESFPVIKF